MKYIIVQGDGMGDVPIAELGGKTPLQAANTPHLDQVAGCGELGLIHTIPDGYPPGSDVGNLSLFGYDPRQYYTGRSPLEAASMGVRMGPEDVSFRMNLVTTSGEEGALVMEDYSSGHIESEDAAELVRAIAAQLEEENLRFYPGVSYRHLMVWRGGPQTMQTTPPHDFTGKPVNGHLPLGEGAEKLRAVMEASRKILAGHPVNQRRLQAGKKPASQAWLWGQGKAPAMPTFHQLHGLKGAVISAVDLIKGVAVYAGFDVIQVPGITGYLDTNYRGKADYALKALADHDLVFIHVEAPDEAGHMGNAVEKVKAIEAVDAQVVRPLLEGLPAMGPFKILITSDHATPVHLKTHTPDPVPYAMATGQQLAKGGSRPYSEAEAATTGAAIGQGYQVIQRLTGYQG